MSNDREKLLQIMSSLEADYKSGKISAEKYSYFRSKYEDKLNSIDAMEATQRIRSMQGKPSSNGKGKKKLRKPARERKEKEDLVQKYIINPKKDDERYNKKKNSSMDSGTFKLLLLLVLVLGFTVGVGYGVFNLDFDAVSDTTTVAIVQDTAFPEFTHNVAANNTYNTQSSNYTYDSSNSNYNTVETTQDTSYSTDSSDTYTDTSQSSQSSDASSSDSGSSADVETTTDGGEM